ncbi:MAG: ribose 5-phosphate isomerase B [Bryobacteraceae bacterium]
MKIAIGADHAGFALKEKLRDKLVAEGHEVRDVGTNGPESTDYPDYAAKVGQDVASGAAERGILVCSSGVGMSIAANKIPGIRAALGTREDEVRLTRSHNDANVLTIGSTFTPEADARRFVDAFLTTEFEGGRHARRVGKITKLEEEANHR